MKLLSKWVFATIIGVLATAAWVTPARAVEEPEDKWTVNSPFYLWFSGMDGDVTVKGRTGDVDLDFSDILDLTKTGFQAYIEVRKPKFGFFANPAFLRLGDEEKVRNTKASVDQDLWIVEFGGFYQVGRWGEERPLTMDVYGGGRFWKISTDAKLNNSVVPFTVKTSSSTELIDPMIGLRVKKYLTDKLSVGVRGDIGGFDISDENTSEFSWQAIPLVGYDFTRHFSLFAGYRALGIDHSENSGAREKGFDLTMHGVLIGFNFDMSGWWKDRK